MVEIVGAADIGAFQREGSGAPGRNVQAEARPLVACRRRRLDMDVGDVAPGRPAFGGRLGADADAPVVEDEAPFGLDGARPEAVADRAHRSSLADRSMATAAGQGGGVS